MNVSIASQSEFTSFAYSSVFASQSQSNDIDTQSIVAEYQDFSLASVDDLIDLSVMNIFSGEGSPKLDNDDNDTADFNSIYGEIAFYEQSLDPLKINVATSEVLNEEIYVVRSTSEDYITTRLETYDSQVDPITGAVLSVDSVRESDSTLSDATDRTVLSLQNTYEDDVNNLVSVDPVALDSYDQLSAQLLADAELAIDAVGEVFWDNQIDTIYDALKTSI